MSILLSLPPSRVSLQLILYLLVNPTVVLVDDYSLVLASSDKDPKRPANIVSVTSYCVHMIKLAHQLIHDLMDKNRKDHEQNHDTNQDSIALHAELNVRRARDLMSSDMHNWLTVIDIARRFDVKTVVCGKTEKNIITKFAGISLDEQQTIADVESSRVLGPCLVAAQPLVLGAAVCVASEAVAKVLELTKAYVAMPELAGKGLVMPEIIVVPTLMNLKNPAVEVSGGNVKDLDSVIFLDDEPADVKRKVTRAFCTPGQLENNPVLEHCRRIVLALKGKLVVTRSSENGMNKVYENFADIEEDFKTGALHPGDLKTAVIKSINEILDLIREQVAKQPELKKLVADVKKYTF